MKQIREKRGLRGMIAQDKAHMLPLNFVVSYLLTPLYVLLAVGALLLFDTLMVKGSVAAGLGCLVAIALLTAALIRLIITARRRAIDASLREYHMDSIVREKDALPSQELWEFSDDDFFVRFTPYGMKLNGRLLYYNHLKKAVLTDNRYQRVRVLIAFVESSENCIALPLSARVLKMLEDFDVRLDNQEELDAILAHPKEAFTEIYRKNQLKKG